MKTKHSRYWREWCKNITPEAKRAKALAMRLANWLTSIDGHPHRVSLSNQCGDYEAHIESWDVGVFSGKTCWCCAMWGGHYHCLQTRWMNESAAWVSLIEDCIGIGDCGNDHKLSNYYAEEHPEVKMADCASVDELDLKLTAMGY